MVWPSLIPARTYTYPTKSINLVQAPKATRYTGLNPEDKNTWNTDLEDPHAVHGITASDGSQILVGKAMSQSTQQDAFAVKVAPNGDVVWTWQSNSKGNDAANAVVEIDNGRIMIVGWKTKDSVGMRSITMLSLETGLDQWGKTGPYFDDAFNDSSGAHASFEMVEIDNIHSSDPLVLLSGVMKKPDLSEMNFKSYGNVANGVAFVQLVRLNELYSYWNRSNTYVTFNPLTSEWTHEFNLFTSAKAARFLPNGNIAVLFYDTDNAKQPIVNLLDSDGNTIWTKTYPEHGEGTDLAIASTGDHILVTGHGGSNGQIAARLTKINSSDGTRLWTQAFTVGGNPNIIYHECWSILPFIDGYILGCGTGIEDGRCNELSGQDRDDCNAGRGDRRDGAYLRKEGNWQSFVLKTNLDGEVIWQRVDSHRCDYSECLQMDDPSFDSTKSGSSAAEWITKGMNDGEVIVITDEVFGVGLLELGGNGTDRIINNDDTNSSAGNLRSQMLFNLFTVLLIAKTIFL